MYILHIPKTGGTAIKYAIESKPNHNIQIISAGHHFHLEMLGGPCMIILRDPFERFCSAFWERKTMLMRQQASEENSYTSFGYSMWTPDEKQILDVCDTPDDFANWIRAGNTMGHHTIINELQASITRWIGNLDTYKAHEHKMGLACEIGCLTPVMKSQFDVDLPTDPFRMRSRKLFDIDQPYELSDSNMEWFKTEYRVQDYAINKYIRSRDYYVKG